MVSQQQIFICFILGFSTQYQLAKPDLLNFDAQRMGLKRTVMGHGLTASAAVESESQRYDLLRPEVCPLVWSCVLEQWIFRYGCGFRGIHY